MLMLKRAVVARARLTGDKVVRSFLKQSHWQPEGALGNRDGSIERAFLRLGDILAEIAGEPEKRSGSDEDAAGSNDTIRIGKQILGDGKSTDGKCSDRA